MDYLLRLHLIQRRMGSRAYYLVYLVGRKLLTWKPSQEIDVGGPGAACLTAARSFLLSHRSPALQLPHQEFLVGEETQVQCSWRPRVLSCCLALRAETLRVIPPENDITINSSIAILSFTSKHFLLQHPVLSHARHFARTCQPTMICQSWPGRDLPSHCRRLGPKPLGH